VTDDNGSTQATLICWSQCVSKSCCWRSEYWNRWTAECSHRAGNSWPILKYNQEDWRVARRFRIVCNGLECPQPGRRNLLPHD
jgi:hypothetical protein